MEQNTRRRARRKNGSQPAEQDFPYTPPSIPAKRQADPSVIEEILGGPPPSLSSDEPDYSGSPGETIPIFNPRAMGRPLNDQPNLLQLQNIQAKLHHIETRQEAIEELIRRSVTAITNLEIRMQQVSSQLHPQPGMRI